MLAQNVQKKRILVDGKWVRIPVTTDAHSTASLAYAELGIGQARRAWLTKEQVLNTRRWDEIAAGSS